jgi:hypothetical protein
VEAPPDVGSGSSTDFCRSAADLESGDLDVFSIGSAADLESSINTILASLDEAAANAPREIADDFSVLRQAFIDFSSLLAEYEYDFFAIAAGAESDPRLLAFETEAIEQAAENIAAFCGVDIDDTDGGSATGPPGGSGIFSGDLPEGFPEELVPPGLVTVESFSASGVATSSLTTTASFDELVEFYTAAMGGPLAVFDTGDGRGAQFLSDDEGRTISVTLAEGDPQMVAIAITDL